ncbi:hypothetical protein ACGF0D_24985 [Kitasatospora sp. NPDC048298]|uniref:hypothetical protein n=1 Tax=Kitasatospora sp. NPDC048298 TaxID=3364049 RepID=UPI00371519C8
MPSRRAIVSSFSPAASSRAITSETSRDTVRAAAGAVSYGTAWPHSCSKSRTKCATRAGSRTISAPPVARGAGTKAVVRSTTTSLAGTSARVRISAPSAMTRSA